MSADRLELTFDLPCAPAEAFAAWTKAGPILRWWGEAGVYRTVAWAADVRPGGAWRGAFEGHNAETFGAEGRYVVIEPPRRLVWTWRASWAPDAESVIEMDFAPAGEATRLALVQTGFDPDERGEQEEGWRQTVGWLAADLARRTG